MLVPCPQVFSSLWGLFLLHLCISLLKWSRTRAVLTPQYTLCSSRTFPPVHISQQVVLQPPGAAVLPRVSPDLPVDVARLSNGSYGSLYLSLSLSPPTHTYRDLPRTDMNSQNQHSLHPEGGREQFSQVPPQYARPLSQGMWYLTFFTIVMGSSGQFSLLSCSALGLWEQAL